MTTHQTRADAATPPDTAPGTTPGTAAGPGPGPGVGPGSGIRVLVVDDQALLRGSFRVLIEAEPGFSVVGEAATGREAAEAALRLAPDVVLMDVRMPDMDGIEATRLIHASPASAGVRVLMLTMFDLDEYVYAALRAGASGFLLKDTPPGELLAAIRVVAAGEALLAPSVTRRLIEEFANRPEPPHPPLTLDLGGVTAREREVLTLVARGLSNAEIGRRLYLSMPTVKSHVSRLLTKLDCRDRAQLVVVAYESGLVTAGSGPRRRDGRQPGRREGHREGSP
ncbi:response regulator [Streptomyces sp. 4N509B]|uniref:response regulator n=1 Tax=Streptomyces sp. 4N509B TaxID=3457413 RepID=UPI003FCFA48E